MTLKKHFTTKTTGKQQPAPLPSPVIGLELFLPPPPPPLLPHPHTSSPFSLSINLSLFTIVFGAGIAQSAVCWARCPAWCSVTGSILLCGSGFPLELTWVLTPFPKNSFGWEYKLRSSLCTYAFHRTDSKYPDIHVLDGWMPATKHIQHAPSMKMECDYLYGWIKKKNGHIYKNLTQKWWIPEI